ncbi:MAG TPA: amidohydrolase family protein [Acidimicrobiia bacterium]|nr:amidohydrolase family protein [Acidimicrobiia bacterium]
MTTVDIHCHLATQGSRPPVEPFRRPEHEPYDYFMGADSVAHNLAMVQGILPALTDPALRIEAMDRMGIDVQGLSTFVSEYFYWAPAPSGAESARIQNDNLAAAAAAYPDRFVALGATVPLQDVDLAIDEIDRAVDELGFKGLQIGGTVNGANLDEPQFRPFWAAVEAKGIPVIIHPSGYPESQRLGNYFLVNCIGNPLETMVAATRLIFSGLFEEHPHLKVILVHGGGYLPFYASRADHTWKVRPETRSQIPDHPPSHYMKMLFFDTVVFEPLYLRHLVEVVGADHVLLGTDYPFDMSETDPLGLIAATEGLDDDDRAAICGGTAARLYGIGGAGRVATTPE